MDTIPTSTETAAYRAVRLKENGEVPWRDVWLFTLLAYALAWAFFAPLIPEMIDTVRRGRTPDDLEAGIWIVIGMYSPALAALIMRMFVSREGVKGVMGPRPRKEVLALAIFGPMVLILSVMSVVTLTGLGDATPDGSLPVLLAVLLVAGLPVIAVLTFGEEFGWRGYLLPKLLPLGELKAALLVGLIWGPWHLPILLVGLNYPDENLIAVLATFQLSVLFLSALHARFFIVSGGSLVVVAILHGSLNNFSDRLTDPDHLSGSPLLVSGGGLITSAFMAAGLVLAYRSLRRRRVGPGDRQMSQRLGPHRHS